MASLNARAVPLDLLRSLAAIWVMVHHWVSSDGLSANLRFSYGNEWVPAAITPLTNIGFLGVDVFFVLSGIVIGRSAIGRDWRDFSRARFLRLYPVYVASIALAISLAPISLLKYPPLSETLLSLTGLQWFMGWPTIVGPAWTLFLEIRFYILVGLVLLVFGPGSAIYLRRAAKIWILLLLLAPSLQLPWLNFVIIAEFGPYFAFGMLCGLCNDGEQLRENAPSVLLALIMCWVRMSARLSGAHDVVAHGLWAALILGLTVAFVVGSNNPSSTLSKLLRPYARGLGILALMSYPIYLLHEQFGMWVIGGLGTLGLSIPVAFAIAGVVVLLISWASVVFYEPWARRHLERLIFGGRTMSPQQIRKGTSSPVSGS